ncbi:hypothetical protein H0E87_020433 [Populus deltoides]|uniref:Sulfotransferase n=1 Tax=Populus deltoides TaxID=3696 RepID=A0A8T2XLS5_POPDE|nr:hypothetical protein H0E87_020433 [Populus deltoides]
MESSLPSTQILDYGESAERKNEAKNYNEVMYALPKVKGLRGNDYYLYQGFWYSSFFLEGLMSVQEHFNPQSTDIILASSPKTGTTWLKALTFAILTRSRLSGSTYSSLLTKMPHDCVPFLEFHLAQNPSNRDLAIPLLSTHGRKGCFCFFVVLFSAHQMSENVEPLPLEEAFEMFCNGISILGPYWDHVLGYWRASLEFPEKILFLTYEEMKKDTAAHVKKLAEFMGCSFTLEEEEGRGGAKDNKHVKGEIGDWANHMTPEMGARLDDIMEQKLKGSGLKLPR